MYGRNHTPPTKFKYCVKLNATSNNISYLLKLLSRFCPGVNIGNEESPASSSIAIFENGLHNFLGIETYIIAQPKQGYYMLWFESREIANELNNKLQTMSDNEESKKNI